MYKGGYTGKSLWIDLTKKTSEITPTDPELARLYMGGTGFGVKLVYDLLSPGIDPLGPENYLVFAPGPLTGTSAPCTSRITVTGRSPLTGAIGMATSGGVFPAEMKYAGFDLIAIRGQADSPTSLIIHNGKANFRSAASLWGMNTVDSQVYLKEDLGDQNFRIACIGPAGERLSLMAGIINERRAMARKGLGAVMGAMRLKAIAVRGDDDIKIFDPKRFQAARRELLVRFKDHPTLYSEFGRYGTSGLVDLTMEMGIFPAKNYTETGIFTPLEEIGRDIQDRDTLRSNPCHNCPVGCSQIRIAKSGDYRGTLTEGPEFETSWSFGGTTGVTDASAIYLADKLCDEYGLDTISVGSTIALAMELYERGDLSPKDVDGLDLHFGNHKAMIELIHRIARREGFGDVLADGAVKASERIGRGSERLVMHVKGLELPGYDVRAAKAQGLNYQTAFTGGDHNRGYAFQEIFGIPVPVQTDRFDPEGKAELTKWNQVMEMALCDCPTICSFMISEGLLRDTEEGLAQELSEVRVGTVSELVSAATGIEFSPQDLILLGERVNTLARCFNLREGFTRKDDYLPIRLAEEPIPGGASEGHRTSREEQDQLLDQYYEAYGYDRRGYPTVERLHQLSLGHVIDDLNASGLDLT